MSLEERLAELERRLATMELARDGNGRANGSAPPEGWVLRRLREEFTDERSGGVMFAGSGRLPGAEQFDWQVQFTTDDIVAYDWDDAAECLAALGSPVRLRILREIIRGSRTAAELTDLDEVNNLRPDLPSPPPIGRHRLGPHRRFWLTFVDAAWFASWVIMSITGRDSWIGCRAWSWL